MLQLIQPSVSHFEVYDNEKNLFVVVPSTPYLQLKSDFNIATHLKSIDTINLYKSKGVIIKTSNKVDGYSAAIYLYKKYLYDQFKDKVSIEIPKTNSIEEEPDLIFDEDDNDEIYAFFHTRWTTDLSYTALPILEQSQYQQGSNNPFAMQQLSPFATLPNSEDSTLDFWKGFDLPIILNVGFGGNPGLKDLLVQESNFMILIDCQQSIHPLFNQSVQESNSILEWHNDLIFELDYELIQLETPDNSFLEIAFKQIIEREGYRLSEDVDILSIIHKLKEFRKHKFESISDIQKIINKAIRRSSSKTLSSQDFLYFFSKESPPSNRKEVELTALQELNNLIGLEEVKRALLRDIEKIKLVKKRKEAGYPIESFHLGAVFMGNPGTAKTTIARIFGKLLFEMGVLSNNVFSEVSRKDLIGQYVGWTAPKVAELFRLNKGGTIFIDEAYSLFNNQDTYSAEACTAIIQEMENNPDTLVIFAGYTEEMKSFIKEANTGLRSRITSILEFPDYSPEELIKIFHFQLKKSSFDVEDTKQTNEIILNFLNKMSHHSMENAGNGRLMRKLFSSAVGYLAQRNTDDIRSLINEDIQNACNEIYKAESYLQNKSTKQPIGFHIAQI